jgi:hypothetical protein
MSKTVHELIIDFLEARIEKHRRSWGSTDKEPISIFFHSTFQITQNFRSRKVRFQPRSKTPLIFRKKSEDLFVNPPRPLAEFWARTLNITLQEAEQLLTQFGNCFVVDHRRRYGPLSRPQARFLKKAAAFLEEGVEKGVYPHWNRTFIIGPMVKKPVKFQNILKEFSEVSNIEFRPLDFSDFGCYFELPWDEYRLRRIPTLQPPASLVIEYSWCELPQNHLPTSLRKTVHESIRAQEFNHLLMTICPLLGDGDVMARLNDSVLSSGGPIHIPSSITNDYCLLNNDQIADFFFLLDICGNLSKTSDPSLSQDWLLIKEAIQALTDARFTHIGMHSRSALAISCIEGLLCKSRDVIGKDDLGIRCSQLLAGIGYNQKVVQSRIKKFYNPRSKFVHGHRVAAAKLIPKHKLFRTLEGYARRLIIIACHLSFNLRLGDLAKKYNGYKLQAILNAATNPQHELNKFLITCICPTGNKIRPLLLPLN